MIFHQGIAAALPIIAFTGGPACAAAPGSDADALHSAGPLGATVRHLLAHASGLAMDSDLALAKPGTRRMYSNYGFTVLADTLPPQNLVDLLNRYFDCQVPAILEHGGEVLKYMGDGLLAIFQISAERDYATTCAAALKAGRAARNQIAALSATDGDGSGLRFGLALHVGDVLFGNIGSGNRLDFTAIGPAVNLAARLEKLAGRLGRTILASEDFVDHCGDDGLEPLGRFAVAGFAADQMVLGLADEGLADEGKEAQ